MISRPLRDVTNREGRAAQGRRGRAVGDSLSRLRDRPHRPQLQPHFPLFCQHFRPFFPLPFSLLPISKSYTPETMVGPRKRGADAEDEEELVALPSDEEDDEEEEECVALILRDFTP